jgi:hypothetical protein
MYIYLLPLIPGIIFEALSLLIAGGIFSTCIRKNEGPMVALRCGLVAYAIWHVVAASAIVEVTWHSFRLARKEG